MMNTPQRVLAGVTALGVPALFAGLIVAQAAPPAQTASGFANPAFRRVWERTDLPVANHTTTRTWYWGPAPNSPGLLEANRESAGGTRLVQYFDKSRMELNNPAGNVNDPFYVTNGLLTVELISGREQIGVSEYLTRTAACIPVTGDNGEVDAPTYFTMQRVSNTTLGDHPATDRMGQVITATIRRDGTAGIDPALSTITGTRIAYFDTVTKHNIPDAFWNFLNSKGPVSVNGQTQTAQLSDPWFYASGRPISEAYWTRATISGRLTQVLVQMYERRVLTYVPTNTPAFQVEVGNIGQHYYGWRYKGEGTCPGSTPQPTFQPTFAPSGTPGTLGTGTPGTVGTGTPGTMGTGTPGTAGTGTPGTMGTGTPGTAGTGTPGATRTGTAVPNGTVVPTITLVVPSTTVVPATLVTDTPVVTGTAQPIGSPSPAPSSTGVSASVTPAGTPVP